MSLSDNSIFISYCIRDASYAVDRLDEQADSSRLQSGFDLC
jgi:hypothetical protein